MSSFTTVKTYEVRSKTSTADLDIVRRSDGSFKFTGASGNVRIIQPTGVDDDAWFELLEAIDALV